MNEHILKRLQDSMKMLSVCLEQLTECGWLIHDIIEDLELELHPIGEKDLALAVVKSS